MRRLAAALGGALLALRGGSSAAHLSRAAIALGLAALSFVLATEAIRAETAALPGGRLWMGLVVLGVASGARGAWECWQVDAWIAVTAAAALLFGAMAALAYPNLEAGTVTLSRVLGFAGVALVSAVVAVGRAVRALRIETSAPS